MHTPKQQMSRSDTGKKTWLKNFKIDREGISEGTRVTRSPIRVTEGDKVVIYIEVYLKHLELISMKDTLT